ncbi:MAG: hypothetical protein ABR542_04575 [Desulfonatronovibrio sp.]
MKSSTSDEVEGKMHQAKARVAEDGAASGFVHCNQTVLDLLAITSEGNLSPELQPAVRLTSGKAKELIAQWCLFGKAQEQVGDMKRAFNK